MSAHECRFFLASGMAREGRLILWASKPMRLNPTRRPDHTHAHRRERLSQLRGLLILAGLVLLWVLYRADRHAIFHPGWWRL